MPNAIFNILPADVSVGSDPLDASIRKGDHGVSHDVDGLKS